ncbi:DUF805 domain-containing protein [Streptomyces sp. NPDC089799]|uniref:DUF805 domain-containing protein n=1 Tax=Streptomyces sp. NPDC089799 TaxID=3155066 RepID=UPI00342DAD70
MNIYLDVLKKYVLFTGRARRQEYWIFTLFSTIASVILMVIDFALGIYPLLTALYILATLLPSLGVSVRRLHDTGKSGWFILLGLIPFVGGIIMLIFMATEGEAQPNAYGPNPKAATAY